MSREELISRFEVTMRMKEVGKYSTHESQLGELAEIQCFTDNAMYCFEKMLGNEIDKLDISEADKLSIRIVVDRMKEYTEANSSVFWKKINY